MVLNHQVLSTFSQIRPYVDKALERDTYVHDTTPHTNTVQITYTSRITHCNQKQKEREQETKNDMRSPSLIAYNTSYRRRYRRLFVDSNETIESFRECMECLYPNQDMPSGRVTRLFNLRNEDVSKQYNTAAVEVDMALDKFRRDEVFNKRTVMAKRWLDMGAGSKGIANRFCTRFPQAKVTTLDKNPAVQADITADYSKPNEYHDLQRPHITLTSCQHDLCDLLLKQALEHSIDGIIAHVQGEYIVNRPDYRTNWFREVAKKGEVRVIGDLPLLLDRRLIKRCVWLVMFKSSYTFKHYYNWPRTGLDHGMVPLA